MKKWPKTVKILKYIIVIWIESEYMIRLYQFEEASLVPQGGSEIKQFWVFFLWNRPRCWEFLGTWTKARGSLYAIPPLPMPELWAKKYPGFSHYLIKSRSRVRSRSYCSSSKKRHKKCPGLLSDDQSYIYVCISVSQVVELLLWGVKIISTPRITRFSNGIYWIHCSD